ncbi:MAG: hypothetical protein IPP81_08970 [Chitinophagaceae bacterium]|nr:hypothetical protein [Chitinophagaceae bacterium]
MKKILPLLFIIAAAGNACAQNAKEIAVALLQHYTELADGSYRELNKQKFKGGDSIIQYDVPSIIEANRTEFTNYEDALKYTLTFYRNNPLAAKTGKEIIKALKILGDKEGYKLNKISDNTYILYKGAEK